MTKTGKLQIQNIKHRITREDFDNWQLVRVNGAVLYVEKTMIGDYMLLVEPVIIATEKPIAGYRFKNFHSKYIGVITDIKQTEDDTHIRFGEGKRVWSTAKSGNVIWADHNQLDKSVIEAIIDGELVDGSEVEVTVEERKSYEPKESILDEPKEILTYWPVLKTNKVTLTYKK